VSAKSTRGDWRELAEVCRDLIEALDAVQSARERLEGLKLGRLAFQADEVWWRVAEVHRGVCSISWGDVVWTSRREGGRGETEAPLSA
jgi:hypothetical protein